MKHDKRKINDRSKNIPRNTEFLILRKLPTTYNSKSNLKKKNNKSTTIACAVRTSAKNPNSIPNSIDSSIPYDRKSFPFNVHKRLCHNLERSQTILRGNRSYVYAWPTYRNLITVLWSGGYRSQSTIVLISASPINWSIIRTERSKRNRPGVCVWLAKRRENYCANRSRITASSSPLRRVAVAI